MQKFEYKILDVPTKGWWGVKLNYEELVSKLNELGREGWEVANTTDLNQYEGGSARVIIILKRPINDN